MKNRKYALSLLALISLPAFSAGWLATYDTDEMRGTSTKFLQTQSDNSVDFEFPYNGGSKMAIILRSKKEVLKDSQKAEDLKLEEVMLIISKGQYSCTSFDGCEISVKFDNDKIKKYKMNAAANGKSDVIFVSNSQDFIKNIEKHKKLIIEADFYQAGAKQFKFDLSGFSNPETK